MSATLRLTRRIVLTVLMAVCLPQLARADFINVISQTYHIHGSGSAFGGMGAFSYDETSGVPLSRNDEFHFTCCGTTGAYNLTTTANGAVSAFSAFLEATRDQLDIGDAFASGDAEAFITFRPIETHLIFRNELGIFPGFTGLYDNTAAQTVLQFGPFGSFIFQDYDVFLDPSHVYTIRASTDGRGFPGSSGARLSLIAAPESESSFTFILSGLVAFVALFVRTNRRLQSAR